MTLESIVGTVPALWALVAFVVLAAAVIFARVKPELVEIYLSESQLLVAAMALAAMAIAVIFGRPEFAREFEGLVPAW